MKYYDLHSDVAKLGSDRDFVEVGSKFDINGTRHVVLCVDRKNQVLIVEEEENGKNRGNNR